MRVASVLGLGAAIVLLGAKGCDNPNGEGVTDRGNVVGRVVEASDPTLPVPVATVTIGLQTIRVEPADKGAFKLLNVPTGTQTLVIASPGYQSYTAQVVVRKDQTSDVGPIGLASVTGVPNS
jgi:hypothetical protein